MKASKLQTVFIILLTLYFTALACMQCLIRYLFKRLDRFWIDKTIQLWADRLLNLAKIRCRIINPYQIEPLPGQATILMCNHTSAYDIPISFKVFPNVSIRMLAKKELSKIPLMGQGMKAAEFPFIHRKNLTQAIKDLEKAKQLMQTGIVIWVCPEGTRSKDGKLAHFKKGAFITAIQAKAQIIPVAIKGAYEILPPKSLRFNLHQTAEINIGKPIDAALYTLENKEQLMEIVHQSMTNLLEKSDSRSD